MPSQELARKAEFGARFEGTTNLAQRRRYQESQEEYDMETRREGQDQYETQLGRAAMRDPLKAENLAIARQRENRMSNEFIAREDRFIRQEQTAAERAQAKALLDAQKLKLDTMKVDIAQRKALREMQDAERIMKHTEDLESADFELRTNGLLPGTEGYAAGIAAAVAQNPYADPNYRKSVLQQAKIDVDDEELMAEYQSATGVKPKLAVTVGADGRKTFRIGPATGGRADDPEKQRTELESQHRRLLEMAEKSNFAQDPESSAYYKQRATEVMGKLRGFGQPSTTTGEAKPIDKDTASSILKEFGGDKEKARAAARERGYQF